MGGMRLSALILSLWALTAWVSSHDHDHDHDHSATHAHTIFPDLHSALATYALPEGKTPLLSDIQRDCELEALNIGTRLADRYNSFDEKTEWDVRIHHDYLTKHLGFAGWIQMGLWKNTQLTGLRRSAPKLHQAGGWAGSKNITESAYWPFNNKWVYMMGDSTQRQIWAAFVSPFQNNEFERNAKEWTRENCARQYPRRRQHPADHYFHEEGWGGRCGNNEVTCHLSGFGPRGKITFDWKHFPYEDYDEYLFGEEGLWKAPDMSDSKAMEEYRFPEILVVHVGLHTCVHALSNGHNTSMIALHERMIPPMMNAIHNAIDRPFKHGYTGEPTLVVIQLPGRPSYDNPHMVRCSRHFNRILAKEAHRHGFVVLEREEIERRLLFKSEYRIDYRSMKPNLHLENPAPSIVGSALLGLVGCLQRNGSTDPSDYRMQYLPRDVS